MAPVAGVLQAGFLTGPGSGQVEARLALFVLAASAALIRGRDGKNLAPAVLLGVAAGFYAAAKYTGLLFLPAAGLALMFLGGRWFSRGALPPLRQVSFFR